jgi:hypothetical protein
LFCLLIGGTGSKSVIIITDPDPGAPKTYKYYGSGSGTLVQRFNDDVYVYSSFTIYFMAQNKYVADVLPLWRKINTLET